MKLPNYANVIKKSKSKRLKPKKLEGGDIRFDYYFKDNINQLKILSKDENFKNYIRMSNLWLIRMSNLWFESYSDEIRSTTFALYSEYLAQFIRSNILYPIEDIVYYITYTRTSKEWIEKSGLYRKFKWLKDFDYVLIFKGINNMVKLPMTHIGDLITLKRIIYSRLEYAIITNIKFD